MIFEKMEQYDYEQLVFCHDKTSGLKAIICIHDSTLGPALGGCRFWNYETEEEAIEDVMRLAKGMTYKNAAAGLNLGGAKTVVMGDPKKDKSEAFFRALGRYINSLDGRYITAEDVNTTVEDMDFIYQETPYVTGISESYGSSGNPSPKTALGVFYAMKRTAKEAFGTDDLEGKTVSVQGLGNVAYTLCEYLHEAGAKLVVTDINDEAVERVVNDFNAEKVGVDDIYSVEADIFAPCALGAILNDDTIPQLKVKAVCGSSNNQLLDTEKHGKMLEDKGIVYAPDFVVNAGGVINVADELQGYNEDRAIAKVKGIYNQMDKIFNIAKEQDILPVSAAEHLAEKRIKDMMVVHSKFSAKSNNQINR
ncbi:Glu/Leu/Phe/Val family dehydrogenase [Staphylococcus massiliensis]|uniref:NAD-specific glutamate dehydrogenase n=1 Tax=Staphylococcus massiliensis S46 TaxID=1229783 RepID=K9ARW8_9STAP|nr:Glu/Leu/Phe/Val dehydrogenase [Staphylococcus massiliensis]EKU50039.1 leucine dehydrogenase [Staphylococcus massiliensis S46]MCG3399202.1 Glu/Leu/Phe/Val dehydrogenase [Staphylococcus massiliensis]MCG3402254.1 Glu/Leu/Phe/Val dehydrogenase [Staphylococcus massiliensis]PNZ97504.1 Glu/Leu/Phe/Val dehydrogenase [Staphylococcus massiliensis CCUG 55927]